MTEEAKIRFLFKKIGHEGLIKTCEAIKIKIATEVVGKVTYKTVTNHLSTAVSELPDYFNCHRNVSVIAYGSTSGKNAESGGGKQSGPGLHYGIFNADGSIHTIHHPN